MLFFTSGASGVACLVLFATSAVAVPTASPWKRKDEYTSFPSYCKSKPDTTVPVVLLTNRLTSLNGKGRGGVDIMKSETVQMTKLGCSIRPDKGFGLFDVTIPNPKGGTNAFKCALAGMPTSSETIPIVEVVNTAKLLRVWNGDGLQWDCGDEPYTSSDNPKKSARGVD